MLVTGNVMSARGLPRTIFTIKHYAASRRSPLGWTTHHTSHWRTSRFARLKFPFIRLRHLRKFLLNVTRRIFIRLFLKARMTKWQLAIYISILFIREFFLCVYPILCGKNSRGWGLACGGGVGGISCCGFSSQGLLPGCGDASFRFCAAPDGVRCSWGGSLFGPTGLSAFGCMFPEKNRKNHKYKHTNTTLLPNLSNYF